MNRGKRVPRGRPGKGKVGQWSTPEWMDAMVNAYPVLTVEQTGALATLWQLGKNVEARNTAVLCNLRLVRKIASKKRRPGEDFCDTFMNGVVGLFRAVDLFDPTRGYAFSTYAYNWIRSLIQRAREVGGDLIRIPNNKTFHADHDVRELARRLGRVACFSELRDFIQRDDADGGLRIEEVSLSQDPDPLDVIVDAERVTLTRAAMLRLTDRQRRFIALHYGFYGEEKTLRQIGDGLEKPLSYERVRQIIAQGEEKMRGVLAGRCLDLPREVANAQANGD